MFHIDPTQAGGPGNSFDGKCDLHFKKDTAAAVAFRWLPTWNYADMSRNPQMQMAAAMFPAGTRYRSMEVRPMPASARFLQDLFVTLHPATTDVNVVQNESMPELEHVFAELYREVNNHQRMLDMPPLQFDAAGLVVDYTEGPDQCRHPA